MSSLQSPFLILALLTLSGCSLIPPYRLPAVEIPAAFKEAPAEGQWKAAEPAEDAARGEWWKIFADPVLDDLESRAATANQDLQAALARLKQALAIHQNARSALFPQIGVGAGPTRQRPSPTSQGLPADAETNAFTLWRAQTTVAYEADLFGRIGSGAEAAAAGAEQQEALLRSVQLAVQADVAQTYFSLRELDALVSLYAETVSLREQSHKVFQRRFDEGDISELDLARSRTELTSARSDALGIARQRAVTEHTLAILLGDTPSSFTFAPHPLTRISAHVPPGLPSALLERRPDIAAAERAMAAANARIGAARAAYFPRLNLTGTLGYESAELGDLFKWSSRAFVMGPLVGTILSLPVFDGGARRAQMDQARAAYEEEMANYRQAILRAFKEVEDNLVHLRLIEEQTRVQDDAIIASRRAATLSKLQYQEGSVSNLSVIDANRTMLQQQRISVILDAEKARATVNLIRALGGGWDVDALRRPE